MAYVWHPAERRARPTQPAPGGAVNENTHGSMVAGAGVAAAGENPIGVITLPAGGPWTVHGLWVMIAANTELAGDCIGGYIRIESLDGDVQPNPAPSRFPTGLGASLLGAVQQQRVCRLNVFPVQYNAPGKCRFQMIYNNATVVAGVTDVVCGLIYGKTRPVPTVFTYIDRVRIQQLVAPETLVGQITLAEKATRITHVGGVMCQDNILTVAENLIGTFRLGSDDINLAPSLWPFSAVFGPGLGATIEQAAVIEPVMIPVDIPVQGGARIDCFVDLLNAVTTGSEVQIYIAYE